MKETYTRLTLETYYPLQDDYRKNIVEVNRWDCSLEEMLNLVDDLLRGYGFHFDREDD